MACRVCASVWVTRCFGVASKSVSGNSNGRPKRNARLPALAGAFRRAARAGARRLFGRFRGAGRGARSRGAGFGIGYARCDRRACGDRFPRRHRGALFRRHKPIARWVTAPPRRWPRGARRRRRSSRPRRAPGTPSRGRAGRRWRRKCRSQSAGTAAPASSRARRQCRRRRRRSRRQSPWPAASLHEWEWWRRRRPRGNAERSDKHAPAIDARHQLAARDAQTARGQQAPHRQVRPRAQHLNARSARNAPGPPNRLCVGPSVATLRLGSSGE